MGWLTDLGKSVKKATRFVGGTVGDVGRYAGHAAASTVRLASKDVYQPYLQTKYNYQPPPPQPQTTQDRAASYTYGAMPNGNLPIATQNYLYGYQQPYQPMMNWGYQQPYQPYYQAPWGGYGGYGGYQQPYQPPYQPVGWGSYGGYRWAY